MHIELEVVGIRIELPANQSILLLKGVEVARFLPIWVGSSEAQAIGIAQSGLEPPRPLTHNLLLNTIEALGTSLKKIVVTGRSGHTYLAEMHTADGHVIDARPSDAVACAILANCKIETTQELIETAGIEAQHADEDEVAQFREFLDHVSPDDFDGNNEQ